MSALAEEVQTQRILSTVPQFCRRYPAFTPGSMRWLLFNRATNGLECAVLRVGRKKLLIDEVKFFEWLDKQQGVEGVKWSE